MDGHEPPKRGFDADRVNAVVQTFAILAAGAWGVYTFVYEARIKPGLEPPSVSVSTQLARAGERGDHVAIRSTLTRKNVGQTGVRILGIVYNVVGYRAAFRAAAGPAALPADLDGADAVSVAAGYTLGEPEIVLRQGTLFAGAARTSAEPSDLNPGEALSRDLVVYADRGRHDLLRFEVTVAYAKEDAPPTALRFRTDGAGYLRLHPDCAPGSTACAALTTTDFATEISLW